MGHRRRHRRRGFEFEGFGSSFVWQGLGPRGLSHRRCGGLGGRCCGRVAEVEGRRGNQAPLQRRRGRRRRARGGGKRRVRASESASS